MVGLGPPLLRGVGEIRMLEVRISEVLLPHAPRDGAGFGTDLCVTHPVDPGGEGRTAGWGITLD